LLKLGKSARHDVMGQIPHEGEEKALETGRQNLEARKIVVFTP